MAAMQENTGRLQNQTSPNVRGRKIKARVAGILFSAMTWTAIILLAVLIMHIVRQAWGWLDWQFVTSFPSRHPEKAGIKAALAGSAWLIGLTAMISVPVGVGGAIYLEEYARKSRLSRLIEVNIANLAGVPSVVYGLLGLTIFVRALHLERSIIAGALTMSLLILPVIITASREAIKAVPASIRHGAFALGATRWEVVRAHVMPAALPGILTGIILSLSRALGEAAPLITISALVFLMFVPSGLSSQFTALPVQVFNWASRPQEEFQHVAGAGILVLLIFLLLMNSLAVILRHQAERKLKW